MLPKVVMTLRALVRHILGAEVGRQRMGHQVLQQRELTPAVIQAAQQAYSHALVKADAPPIQVAILVPAGHGGTFHIEKQQPCLVGR